MPLCLMSMQLKHFLNKYDTVILDMDGVITSEQNYWNAAALTVWECLSRNRDKKIDVEYCTANCNDIREKVFHDDELISILKKKGVNSNWDLGYITLILIWIYGDNTVSDHEILINAGKLPDNIINGYDKLAQKCAEITKYDYEWLKRGGLLWNTMRGIFQEWYLGDKLFYEQYGYMPKNTGKIGLIRNEKPIISKDKLQKIIQLLSENKRICIGTGRPKTEITKPLEEWGVLKYFSENGRCTYDYIEEAQSALGLNNLTKPNPYMFLKALYGTDYSDEKIVSDDYDKEKIKTTLVVGDAGADMLAAKEMGADFCAVLTGIDGEEGREYFEKREATYILNSIADFCQ